MKKKQEQNKPEIQLRDYQTECIDILLKISQSEKVVVKLPTGSGKTIILTGLVDKLPDSRILIIVPSTELREQTIDKLKLTCGDDIDVGSVQSTLNQFSNRIIVSTRQSLTHSKSTRLEQLISHGDFEYIIFDECHQAVFQIQKILIKIKELQSDIKTIGLTATPYNQDMKLVFDKIIYEKHILDMIMQNYLVEPRCKIIHSSTDISSVKSVAGELNLGQLESIINNSDRNQLIVDAYKKFAIDRSHCLIFATGIEHAQEITDTFNRNNIKAYSVDSGDTSEDRKNILSGFTNGKYKVLVNIGILTTGFDMPSLDCIILARPTKSRILYEQIIGRALRTFPMKKDSLIIDIVDIAKNHNLMSMDNVFNIEIEDGETPTEAKSRIDKLAEDEKLRLAEMKRIKEEQLKREQELIAEEIELFNQSMKNILYYSNLDWFRFNDNIYSVMGNTEIGYSIQKLDNTNFIIYKVEKLDKRTNIEEVYQTNSLQDSIKYTDGEVLEYGTSFCKKKSKWKYDKATDNQLKYISNKQKEWCKTKWDVNKVFFNSVLWKHFNTNNKKKW